MDDGRKILVIIMDGLGDRAVKSLGYKTPLQCANKPNIDWFAANGTSGIMDVIAPGVRPGSDTSHLAILGYDPFEVYTGRGPFEAAGVGLVGKAGDVAFRCNFATVDDRMNVTDRRAGRINAPDTTELARTLDGMSIGDVTAVVKEATEHRAVLILKGPGLSPYVTDADPHALSVVSESEPLRPEATRTAEAVNEFVRRSYEVLKDHPVNERRVAEG
ncbi:MAG TPA: phosphoglycerate mutase, partial [Methanomassiliicoccaceae archaeon]|nr:phosphoglycerate mutase [Methanomassiliicoccaceae archaeon]